jgi:molecular chaperone DnaJ
MSAKRDYYEVLGISKDTQINEIKSQYRKLALKFHPDRNKSSEAAEHFKEISEAYAVLSDTKKRQLYDQHGHAGVDGRYSTEDIFRGAGFNFDDVGSIFENLFGGRGQGFGGFGRQRGSDLLHETFVSLEDVLNGKRMDLDLQKNVDCPECNGSGCFPGTSKTKCSDCDGQGQVRISRNMGFSTFVTVQPCRKCSGQGMMIKKPCKKCKLGKVKGTKHISFELPAGIDNGDYVISGEGESIPGGVSGDLIIRVNVQPHPKFKRDGRDIFYDTQLSMTDASLGKNLEVPTLEGFSKITVEPGSQPNTIIKLKGKGLQGRGFRGRGDQYVRLVVNIPKKLNKHQKDLLKDLEHSFD